MPTLDEWKAGVDAAGNILDPVKSAGYRRKAAEQEAEAALPPLLIRGCNFAAAMAKWALCGFPLRPKQSIAKLLKICEQCDHFDSHHKRCRQCGCCVETGTLISKLTLASEHCPEGKW